MLRACSRALVVTLLLSACTAVSADDVVLKNGEVLRGEIVGQTATEITLQTLTQTLRLPRARVKEVKQSAPGTLEMMRSRDALRKNQIDESKKYMEAAKAKGALPAELDALAAEIGKKQSELELARYSRLIDEARKAASVGEKSPALEEIRKILDGLPADSPSRRELIDILAAYHLACAADHRDKVSIQAALAELKQVIELDPERAAAYLQMGDIYKSSAVTNKDAVACYGKAVKFGSKTLPERDLTRAYWEVGEIFRQTSKHKEAAGAYRRVFERDPGFNIHLRDHLVDALRDYAREVETKDPDAALVAADEALKVRSDTSLLMMKGKVLNRLGKHAESNAVLDELLVANPRLPDVHYIKAQNFFGKGEILMGREELTKEIALSPNNFEALIQLGDLALQRDDYEAAAEFYLKAKDISPEDPRALLGLGKTYRLKNELANARTYVSEVLTRLPDDREANLEMGRILVAEEKLEEAKKFFTSVLDLIDKAAPEEKRDLKRLQADALIARGEINLLLAGAGTANKDFRGALDVVPDYGQAYYSIGIAYRKKFNSSKELGDLKTSEENLLKSRELAPENPQFALQLGILYSQDLAQADADNRPKYLEKAVKNWQDYIDLGGANTAQVKQWIQEIKG